MNVLIRADSSAKIGLGHVMRCMLLAQRMKQIRADISIVFACQKLEGDINERIKLSFPLHQLSSNNEEELIAACHNHKIDLLIIDHYQITYEQEKKIVAKCLAKVLVFDDCYWPHYADMVVNHGIHALKKDYNNLLANNTRVFCGSRYTLIRDEFLHQSQKTPEKNHIAIILGGNDALNLSATISELLYAIDRNLVISLLTTRANPHIAILKSLKQCQLIVDSSNIAEHIQSCELVVCSSSTVLFEVMAMKKKFVNIQLADNQQAIGNYLESKRFYSTILKHKLSKQVLQEKLDYVRNNDFYSYNQLNFSKTHLPKAILSEFEARDR